MLQKKLLASDVSKETISQALRYKDKVKQLIHAIRVRAEEIRHPRDSVSFLAVVAPGEEREKIQAATTLHGFANGMHTSLIKGDFFTLRLYLHQLNTQYRIEFGQSATEILRDLDSLSSSN